MKIFDVLTFLSESNAIEDVRDIQSLIQAATAWEYLMEQPELNMGVILKMHKILMLHQPLAPDEKGYFRTVDVYIGGHKALNPESVRYALQEWIDDMNKVAIITKRKKEGVSKKLHVEYERIHPFVDGNGRTGRMFMNWYRVRNGMDILTIHEGQEQHAYYTWFK